MSPIQSLRIALSGLLANKLRSILTLLGVVIGVGAVISVMSIGQGSSSAIASQIESVGTNLVFVRPGAAQDSGVRSAQGSGLTLTYPDALAIGEIDSISGIAPEVSTFAQIKAGAVNVNTRLIGTTPDYIFVNNFKLADGDFLTDFDMQGRTSNAVLGAQVALNLFGDGDPIGQTILINSRAFQVAGILAPRGGGSLGNQDDVVLLPLTTVTTRLVTRRTAQGAEPVNQITVQAASKDEIEVVKQQITAILQERHRVFAGSEDFTLTTQDDLIQARSSVTNVLTILLGSIAGISLIVGGIGIMNIMLVSVTERIREIGIRKAVGAKRRDILGQFLSEATLLSLGGGGAGLAAGWGVSKLLNRLTINGQQVQTLVTIDSVLLSVGVAIAIGLFFGIYPAVRAARLDPLEALRSQ